MAGETEGVGASVMRQLQVVGDLAVDTLGKGIGGLLSIMTGGLLGGGGRDSGITDNAPLVAAGSDSGIRPLSQEVTAPAPALSREQSLERAQTVAAALPSASLSAVASISAGMAAMAKESGFSFKGMVESMQDMSPVMTSQLQPAQVAAVAPQMGRGGGMGMGA